MKEVVPPPPAIVHNETARIQQLFQENVLPTYGRFELAFSRGSGSYLYDVAGKRYLDLGAGIAVCCLGHAHPEITDALIKQSQTLVHISNLYYHEPQGRLAKELVTRIGPGKVFFSNSGAEANEGLYKLARKFGHDEGRFEVLTAINSFHGRTLAGIAATGQEKVKKGFEPMVAGFRHVPYNDLEALRAAISPGTAAVLIEGVQGEGGITPASAEYLIGLRQLCDEKRLLLLIDEVQCGHYRTGRFHSYQRALEGVPGAENWLPDGVSMAKSLGGGFPIGAFWVRKQHADLLGPGTHATTYGGSPLGCAVALRILEVIQRDGLEAHARKVGDFLRTELQGLVGKYPSLLKQVRGIGLMLGLELAANSRAFDSSEKAPSIQFVNRLHHAGMLTVPAGTHIIRLLPALNFSHGQAREAIQIFDSVLAGINQQV